MTSGPSLPSSMSTPATRRPMICAERTAACSYSGVELDRLDGAAAVHVGAELVALGAAGASPRRRGRRRRGRGCRGPCSRLTKLWMRTFCLVLCSVSMIASATLMSGARMTPMPCVPSSSLMTTGAPPTRSMAGMHVGAVAHERRGRHADLVAREDLRGPQLVAGVGDAVGRVRRVDVHLLELAHDGGAEVGDRVADARQDRVVVGQRLAAELQVRLGAREVDGEAQRVEHLAPGGRGRALRCAGAACE